MDHSEHGDRLLHFRAVRGHASIPYLITAHAAHLSVTPPHKIDSNATPSFPVLPLSAFPLLTMQGRGQGRRGALERPGLGFDVSKQTGG